MLALMAASMVTFSGCAVVAGWLLDGGVSWQTPSCSTFGTRRCGGKPWSACTTRTLPTSLCWLPLSENVLSWRRLPAVPHIPTTPQRHVSLPIPP